MIIFWRLDVVFLCLNYSEKVKVNMCRMMKDKQKQKKTATRGVMNKKEEKKVQT